MFTHTSVYIIIAILYLCVAAGYHEPIVYVGLAAAYLVLGFMAAGETGK